MIVARAPDGGAVLVAVSDSSPRAPVMRAAAAGTERGRGLRIVGSLAAYWGWHREPGGKVVFAVLAVGAGA